jgi:hypothetical protein
MSTDEEGASTGAGLSSWREGPAKRAVVDFVRRTSDENGAEAVPIEERTVPAGPAAVEGRLRAGLPTDGTIRPDPVGGRMRLTTMVSGNLALPRVIHRPTPGVSSFGSEGPA